MRWGGRLALAVLCGSVLAGGMAMTARSRDPGDCRAQLQSYTEAAVRAERAPGAAAIAAREKQGASYLEERCRVGLLLDANLGVDETIRGEGARFIGLRDTGSSRFP